MEKWYLNLAQKKVFWKTQILLKKIIFLIGKIRYLLRYGFHDEKNNFQSLFGLLTTTKTQLILALVSSLFLQYIDPKLGLVYSYLHINAPDDEMYGALLNSVIAIIGVFIALYYATVSAVGSAIYSRVSNNIRELLARERIGFVYMRFLTYTAFLSLCLIGLRALGFPTIHLAVPLISIFAGIGIIGFIRLGQRAFNFFDPTQLSTTLFERLFKQLDNVKAGGFQWDIPSFQEHSRKLAKSTFESIETLSEFISKEIHLKGKPYTQMVQSTIIFLIHYTRMKITIPSESLWFQRRYKHKNWLLSTDSSVAIASQTGTQLTPEVVNDKEWVEDIVFPIVLDCLRTNLVSKQYSEVIALLGYIEKYINILSEQGDLKQAFNRVTELSDVVNEFLAPSPIKSSTSIKVESLEEMAIIEIQVTMMIQMFLAYMKYVDSIERDGISRKLKKINWKRTVDIYRNGFSSHILPNLEWLSNRIQFEIKIEDKVVTPLWYQVELLALLEANKMEESIIFYITESAQLFSVWIDQTEKLNRPLLTSAIISREWEYWNKVSANFHRFVSSWDKLNEKKYIKDLKWPEINFDIFNLQIQNRKKEILKSMSKLSLDLMRIGKNDNIPDYGGQFFHTTGEGILEAFINNDFELIESLFKPYFYSCLTFFDNQKPEGHSEFNWRDSIKIKIASAPLLDLMDLSGYGHLLSDYHNNPKIGKLILEIWDEYIQKSGIPLSGVIFSSAVVLSEMGAEIAHRSVLRQRWKQSINMIFKNIPRKKIYIPNYYSEILLVQHNSPLVRLFAKDDFKLRDGIDIFINSYFRQKSEFSSINFGRRRSGDVQKALMYEEEIYKKAQRSGKEEE